MDHKFWSGILVGALLCIAGVQELQGKTEDTTDRNLKRSKNYCLSSVPSIVWTNVKYDVREDHFW